MSKKKSAEIKPGKAAEVVDQESQVSKVQVLSTEQMDNTTILPDTIIVDPSVEVDPVKEGPVLNEETEEKDVLVISPDSDNVFDDEGKLVAPEFDEKAEAELAGDDESKEPTRYGAGKEVIADQIEEGGTSRHYPPPAWGDATGGKNEYPR